MHEKILFDKEMYDEVNEKINYSLCCLSKPYEGCGVHTRTGLSGLFKFSDLSNKIKKGVTEGQLVCSKINHSFQDDDFLWAFHRQNYGRYWKAPHRSQLSEHTYPTKKNKMKVKDIHKSTIEQYDFINSKYPKRFPLFGNLCGKHRSIYNDIDIAESIDKSDELYVPDEPGHSTFSMDDSNDFLRKSFENIFPVRYQANKSEVNESASSSLKYYKRKFEY